MNHRKQTAVVICPGRGTYNKTELGYLHRYHADKTDLINIIDTQRRERGQPTVTELDSMARYNLAQHTAGENASSLIYACAAGDFADIDREKYDIVAVTGNSMGWYIALAVAEALRVPDAATLINTMGSMMKDGVIGGQLIYPVTDANWHYDHNKAQQIADLLAEAKTKSSNTELYLSIALGGYAVLGGNEEGISLAQQRLPRIDDTYPMRLFNHAAFHTPLLKKIAEQARNELSSNMFNKPSLPLIDGEGRIWHPHSTDTQALWGYTLGTQVVAPYHFSTAIEVALKEFAPDKLIVTGPGTTLGGAIGQCLVEHKWHGIASKQDFIETQQTDPFVLAMGMADQRTFAV
ncbi:ACP S-malonyltransferase [Alteromonas ponticola]|uniref:[acyl-carrier-protein] S-malonyltransferase n=1 Tax=Alteromonas aquimaris TaxID=2998417 RepID=A0ABT3P682_9ALTE|nr:ACP S-malonyltransferase [Alteromonas aquimaris]MCW8108281.1 ACP S-malonyltransferase [Alteromonas aquimaris]